MSNTDTYCGDDMEMIMVVVVMVKILLLVVYVVMLTQCWVDAILDLQRCVLRHFFLLSSQCPLFSPSLCALFSWCVLFPSLSCVLVSS